MRTNKKQKTMRTNKKSTSLVKTEINGKTLTVHDLWDITFSIDGKMSLGYGGNDLAIYVGDGLSIIPCGGDHDDLCVCDICEQVREALNL